MCGPLLPGLAGVQHECLDYTHTFGVVGSGLTWPEPGR